MEIQTDMISTSDTLIHTDQPSNSQPKRRGRKPKNQINNDNIISIESSSEIEVLKEENIKLQEELNSLKQIVSSILVTQSKPLIICPDEDINQLYFNYLTSKQIEMNDTKILESPDGLIITKSYYKIG